MRKGKHQLPCKLVPAAMEETLKLYHAWLGYLLSLLDADTLRQVYGIHAEIVEIQNQHLVLVKEQEKRYENLE